MKFSSNWISELAGGLIIDPKELANLITTKTAEQEGVEPVGAWLDRVCTARVLETAPIPGSKNQRAVVDTGRYGVRTVVCGAANCRPGIVTAFVPPGTTLPGGKRIETAVVSGVESGGMLASGSEIGINREAGGVMELTGVVPGAAISGCRPDHIIDIDNKSLTHRPDLWGHRGMAREVAAITGGKLQDPVDMSRLPSGAGAVQVEIADHALCPRYSALVFDNVTVGPSPLWLQYQLESIGLNPINNIVDVTNYVMAELSQPMHAFDHDTLAGDTIFVRCARAGEKITALNKEPYDLDEHALVIADANGPVAIAGVIGGLDTGVTGKTRRIVFESANFHAGHIRKTSARLKCRTDASMRFEKSQDPENTTRALARAVALLEQVSPGIRLVGGLVDNRAAAKPAKAISLPLDWLRIKLGRPVETAEVRSILESLGFGVTESTPGTFSVTVPSWRATKDISIKDDLVEEVGRMLGYGSITPTPPAVPAMPPPANPERDFLHHVRAAATNQGFTESYGYSFVNEQQVAELGLRLEDHVRVLNPIASDQDLLRTTLLCGVLKNIRGNLRHFNEFRFFEIGYEIHKQPASLPQERAHLAAAVCARAGDGVEQLLEVKRLAECLLSGATVQADSSARGFEHPYRVGNVMWRGNAVGRIFEFHPKMVESARAAVLDLDLEAVRSLGSEPKRYRPLLRFPTSAFDLSVVAGLRVPVGDISSRIAAAGGENFLGVDFVTQYMGKPLPEDRKSVSFRVTVGAADRTLSNDEINRERTRLIAALQAAGYELRI